MNTIDCIVSILNHNSDLQAPLLAFLSLLQPHPDVSFREHEVLMLVASRRFSTICQSLAAHTWSAVGPEQLLHHGQLYQRTGRSTKSYVGLDGPLAVERDLYKCPQTGHRLCPFELRTGIVESRLTPAAARLELMSTAFDDYRMTQQLHDASFVLHRSKSAMQRDVQMMGQQIHQHIEHLESVRRDALEPVANVHSISVSVDRTGLPFEEPLPKKPGRPKKNQPKQPCQVVKRQVYCASLCLHDKEGKTLMTQRFTELPDKGDLLVKRARTCLKKLIKQHPDALLVQICDGAKEMQRRGREILQGFEVEHHLVDAWHAASYVNKAFSEAGYSQNMCKEMVRRLIENKTGVLEILTRLRTTRLTKKNQIIEETITYLTNNQEQMCYAQAREKGLAIGSGSVEATCKCVVAVRFKRSGARWKADGAAPLMQTRSWITSDQNVWLAVCDAFLDTYVASIAS